MPKPCARIADVIDRGDEKAVLIMVERDCTLRELQDYISELDRKQFHVKVGCVGYLFDRAGHSVTRTL